MSNSTFKIGDFITINASYDYGMGSGSQGQYEISGYVTAINLFELFVEIKPFGKIKSVRFYFSTISRIQLATIPSQEKATVKKIDNGHFIIYHKDNSYEAKNVAYNGRLRVWERVRGARGMKRGDLIIKEYSDGVQSLRKDIEKGILFKDFHINTK